VDVYAAKAFEVVDTLPKGLLSEYGGKAYVADISSDIATVVKAYDSTLQVLSNVTLSSPLNQPQAFDVDAQRNSYFLDRTGLFIFDSTGAMLDTLDLWSSNDNKTLIAHDSLIILVAGVIRTYSKAGELVDTLDERPDFRADGATVHNGLLLVGGRENEVRVYDLSLSLVESWSLDFRNGENVWSLATDQSGNIYVIGYHSNPDHCTLLIYDSARVLSARIDLGDIAKHFVVVDGRILLSQGDNLLLMVLKQ
jgi:outer membrane protein assembly factor BamB